MHPTRREFLAAFLLRSSIEGREKAATNSPKARFKLQIRPEESSMAEKNAFFPEKESLWKFGGLTPLGLGKRVWRQMGEDDTFNRAAQLAYYFLFALFPALLFLTTVLGFVAKPGSTLHHALFSNMARMMPGSASDLISKTLDGIHDSASGLKLAFGLGSALWSAAGGVVAIMTTLNIAYRVKETRSFVRQKVTAIGLTFACSTLVLIAIALVVGGEKIAKVIASHVGFGSAFVVGWEVLQWPVMLGLMLAAFAAMYYFAPNVEDPSWYWVSPGAVAGMAIWLLASLALRIYLHFFNSYSATYGSLGAVIILMTWFYLTGCAILIGGEVNSSIGHAAEERVQKQRKLKALEMPRAA